MSCRAAAPSRCPRPRARRGSRRPRARAADGRAPSASPTTGSNALAARRGVSGSLGRREQRHRAGLRVREQAVERRATAAAGRARRPRPTWWRASRPATASSSSSSCARSRMRFGSTSSTSAVSGRRSGRRCSRSVSHGSHDSMPSNTWPSARRSHCSRPTAASRRARRRGPHLVGGQQLAGREDPRLGDVVGGALVGDRERGQAVDLVAPEVDAHRMVVGRRVHVDDRAAHRDLAARLDLVLAPVAAGDEARDQLVAVDLVAGAHDDRLDLLDVRAEALHQRPHRRDDDRGRRARPGGAPHHPQAPAHRLERRRDPLERQGLPRREQLDLVRRRGTARGRARAARPRRRSAPPRGSAGGW